VIVDSVEPPSVVNVGRLRNSVYGLEPDAFHAAQRDLPIVSQHKSRYATCISLRDSGRLVRIDAKSRAFGASTPTQNSALNCLELFRTGRRKAEIISVSRVSYALSCAESCDTLVKVHHQGIRKHRRRRGANR
jgi:hypothetical protein